MEMIREISKRALITLAVAMAVGLAGCGGGGDDEPEPATFDGSTSGTVDKGIIQSGTVTAEELDDNGNVIQSVGTAQTDANGEYTLEIGDAYGGGVVRLTLTADGTTTKMICDVQPDCSGTPYGEAITLDSSFSMTALLPAVQDGASVSAQITPFSHMAASLVSAGTDGFTADAVNNAISEISQMVGVDILNVSPVDITDATSVDTSSSNELIYSVFTAGVGALMFEAADLTTGLQQLAETFADGLFDSSDPVSIIDIIDAVDLQADYLQTAYPEVDLLLLDQVLATIESELEDSDGDGILDEYDPEPTDTATLTALEQAKGLVSEVRTLVTSIEELESPASLFQGELEATKTILSNNTEVLLKFAGRAIETVVYEIGVLAQTGDLALDTEFTADIYNKEGVLEGQVLFTLTASDTGGLVIELTVVDAAGVDMNLTLDSNVPAAEFVSFETFTQSEFVCTALGSVQNAETTIELMNTNIVISYESASAFTPDPDSPFDLIGDPNLTSMQFAGEIQIVDSETTSSFTGNTTIELVELNADYAFDSTDPNPLSLSEITLDGVIATSTDSFSTNLGLTVNNAATFDTFAFLEQEPALWVDEREPGDTVGFSSYPSIDGYSLLLGGYESTLDQTCFYVSELVQPICEPGDVLDTYSYFLLKYPNAFSISNYAVWYDAVGMYDAIDSTGYYGYVEFEDFESADSYVEATLTTTLNLALEGYPETTAIITVDRTELDKGSAIVTLTHDGNSITFNAELADPEDADVYATSITVTNPDGAALVVTLMTDTDPISGELTVDDVVVGTLYEVDGVLLIRYEDGSFETLY